MSRVVFDEDVRELINSRDREELVDVLKQVIAGLREHDFESPLGDYVLFQLEANTKLLYELYAGRLFSAGI